MPTSSSTRTNALHIYKQLVRVSNQMPIKQRNETLTKIREQFRSNSSINDVNEVKNLLTKASSTLGYLKIITPKTKSSNQSGITKIVFSTDGGSSTSATKKAISNWHGGNMDPDAVKRHFNGLQRAGFKNNSDAKGGLF